jgi:hypothetical protein
MPDDYQNYPLPPGVMEIAEVQLAAIERTQMTEDGVTTTPMIVLDLVVVPLGHTSPLGRATFLLERPELLKLREALDEALEFKS